MTDEPEATQEMIEDGRSAFIDQFHNWILSLDAESLDSALAAIYRAMHKARPKTSEQTRLEDLLDYPPTGQ